MVYVHRTFKQETYKPNTLPNRDMWHIKISSRYLDDTNTNTNTNTNANQVYTDDNNMKENGEN